MVDKPSRLLVLTASTFLVSGCLSNNQFSRQQAFSSEDPQGLVVFGVNVQGFFKAPRLTFVKYDPATNQSIPGATFSASPRKDHLTASEKLSAAMSGQSSRPGGHNFFVLRMPPGNWLLHCIHGRYNDGLGNIYDSRTCLGEGTVVFAVEPGTAIYLGEYGLHTTAGKRITFKAQKRDLSAAATELEEFTGVAVELTDHPVPIAQYECERTMTPLLQRRCHTDNIVITAVQSP